MKNILLCLLIIYVLVNPCVSIARNDKVLKKDTINNNEYLMQSVLWYKYSGEMKALYYQAYNIAKLRMDEYINNSKTNTKKAIILDLDETVIDNSNLFAEEILNNINDNNNSWKHWTDKAIADTVAGAVDFLKYAASKNVEIFYITNREKNEFNSTLINLRKYKIPYADSTHLLCKSETSVDKEIRRKFVAKDHDIILLCGDNLNDFSDVFYLNKNTSISTNEAVKQFKHEFGKRFIVFPNPIYGYWENKIYNSKKLSDEQKRQIRKDYLKDNYNLVK
jgi:5'-nucleotidase (lipoprotein e(P4) family)